MVAHKYSSNIAYVKAMTAIKAKAENRVILDFSERKCSKNRILNALRKCEVISLQESTERPEFTIFSNEIKVGMYTIVLELPLDGSSNWHRLRDYGDFQVSICDNQPINLKKDGRFKDQYWVANNFFGNLRIKHLVDIVDHCYRLNQLKAFL